MSENAKALVAPVSIKKEAVHSEYGKEAFNETFRLPSGTEIDYFLFRGTPTPAIIFPLTIKREVVLVNQFRYGANEFVLELPGGCPDGTENLESVVTRELLEETGYRAGEVTCLNERGLWFEPAAFRTRFVPYLALGCTAEKEPSPDPEEIMTIVTVPLSDIVRLISQGTIRDSKSIAITLLALQHFGLMS